MKIHVDQTKELQLQSLYNVPNSILDKQDLDMKNYSCNVSDKIFKRKANSDYFYRCAGSIILTRKAYETTSDKITQQLVISMKRNTFAVFVEKGLLCSIINRRFS